MQQTAKIQEERGFSLSRKNQTSFGFLFSILGAPCIGDFSAVSTLCASGISGFGFSAFCSVLGSSFFSSTGCSLGVVLAVLLFSRIQI